MELDYSNKEQRYRSKNTTLLDDVAGNAVLVFVKFGIIFIR